MTKDKEQTKKKKTKNKMADSFSIALAPILTEFKIFNQNFFEQMTKLNMMLQIMHKSEEAEKEASKAIREQTKKALDEQKKAMEETMKKLKAQS